MDWPIPMQAPCLYSSPWYPISLDHLRLLGRLAGRRDGPHFGHEAMTPPPHEFPLREQGRG